MKKYIFILAATAIIASCAENDTFKTINGQEADGEAINFTSYTQKATKAENSSKNYDWVFFNHHTTFRVWAYKTTSTTPVFKGTDNEVVTVDRSGSEGNYSYSYTYTDKHFWDKSQASKYNFYAAAPGNGGNSSNGDDGKWVFITTKITDETNQDLGYFKTTSKLTGSNLKDGTTDDRMPSTTLSNVFKGENDIDKLIAEHCEGTYDDFASGNQHIVPLHFIHILSKLNVTVKKDATVLGSKTVKLTGIKVEKLFSTGDFSESNDNASTSTNASNSGSLACWSNQDGSVSYVFSKTEGIELNSSDAAEKKYFIESLVIPQTALQQEIRYNGDIIEYYEDYQAYNAGHANDAVFTPLQDADEFDNLPIKDKMKPITKNVKTSNDAKPYIVINYTIDGEPFESCHNLATAFQSAVNGTTLDFFEGYQNTLNINILPEEIKFTADVAEWDDKTVNPTDADLD